MKKIIYYVCKKCGYKWEEETNNLYKTGTIKECPVCHSFESEVKKQKIVKK